MKSLSLLVLLCLSAQADRPAPRTDQNSKTAHAQLLDKAKRGRIDIYFAGDSIVRRWGALDYPELLANWKENFFGWNAANFGWGADSTQNILWRLENGELDGVNPKVIVLLAGTNNVGAQPRDGPTIAEIARGVKALVDVCRQKAPDATIILTAIFPRHDNIAVMPTIDGINRRLAAFADGRRVRFLNINDRLVDANGNLVDGVLNERDKLHPTLKGYQIWADALKPIFRELLGPPGPTDLAPPPTGDPSAVRAPQGPPTRETLANNPPLFLELARKGLKWDEPAEPAKIVGPIYSVGTKGLSVFLIRTTAGLIIINTAMPGSGPMTETAIRRLGMEPKDIRLLLTGHAHSDHAGAHAYLQKISNARVAVIAEEKALLESGGRLDFHYAKYKEFYFDPPKVDWVFKDGEIIKLGDVAITALLTPGHTKGSTTFVTNVVDDGRNYTVVLANGLSINPGYRLAKDPSYVGIADNYRRTLQTLERLKPDIWLSPHTETYGFDAKLGRSQTEGVKAWVDPDGYRRWLVEQRESFEKTVNEELGVTVR